MTGNINNLNNDCLEYVFKLFHPRQRIALELVCKRWHQLCRQTWLTEKNCNFLEVIGFPEFHASLRVQEKPVEYEQLHSMVNNKAKFVFSRARNLRKLKLHSGNWDPIKISDEFATYLTSYCKNIEVLNFQGAALTGSVLKILASNYHNLRELTFGHLERFWEDDMAELF